MVRVAVSSSTLLAVRVGAAGAALLAASEAGPAPVAFTARTLKL